MKNHISKSLRCSTIDMTRTYLTEKTIVLVFNNGDSYNYTRSSLGSILILAIRQASQHAQNNKIILEKIIREI